MKKTSFKYFFLAVFFIAIFVILNASKIVMSIAEGGMYTSDHIIQSFSIGLAYFLIGLASFQYFLYLKNKEDKSDN